MNGSRMPKNNVRFPVVPTLLLACLALASCTQQSRPLPSWTDGPTRTAIIEFVSAVTDEAGPDYVAPEERIATFDNDGTLWCEQPVIQFAFAMARVQEMAADHPEWQSQQPFKAAIAGDMDYLFNDYASGGKGLFELLAATHTGMSLAEFTSEAQAFFAQAQHPRFAVPYTRVAYLPMLELLDYLRANGFKTYICSGGGIDFMRAVSEEIYGIVPEQVIGSNGRNVFREVDGTWQLMKTAERMFKNDKEGKPEGIDLHIGRVPIFAAGNVRSGGDIAMLTHCSLNAKPSFQLLVNHDDGEREYAYAEQDDASLKAARAGGWQIVSMKDDWQQVFDF